MRAIPLNYRFLRNGFEFVWAFSDRAPVFATRFGLPCSIMRSCSGFAPQPSRLRLQSGQAQESA